MCGTFKNLDKKSLYTYNNENFIQTEFFCHYSKKNFKETHNNVHRPIRGARCPHSMKKHKNEKYFKMVDTFLNFMHHHIFFEWFSASKYFYLCINVSAYQSTYILTKKKTNKDCIPPPIQFKIKKSCTEIFL